MKNKKLIYCKQCGEFIGNANDLEECPICCQDLSIIEESVNAPIALAA